MQSAFDFTAADLAFMRSALAETSGPLALPRRAPIWQLVRSLLGGQTYDTIAVPALKRVMRRWPHPSGIAAATPEAVLRVIADVTHAEVKASHLIETMRRIGRERPDYDLSFLKDRGVGDALAWLERFPGVGPKVAASTLNASTLAMPAFIVDSHVHRILLRFGFIGAQATARHGRDAVTAALPDADDLLALFVGMKRLGQTLCRPFAAQCGACPLDARCQRKTELGRPPDAAPQSIIAPFSRAPRRLERSHSPGSRVAERQVSRPVTRRT